jgi:hypothetical protein
MPGFTRESAARIASVVRHVERTAGTFGTTRRGKFDAKPGASDPLLFSFRCTLSTRDPEGEEEGPQPTITISRGFREVIGRPGLASGTVEAVAETTIDASAGYLCCSWTYSRGGTDDPLSEDEAGAWSDPFWFIESSLPVSDYETFYHRHAQIVDTGGVLSLYPLHLGDVVVHPMPPPTTGTHQVPRVNANGGWQQDDVRAR